jgi:hypothetical protein
MLSCEARLGDCTAEARRTLSKEFLIKNSPNSVNSVLLSFKVFAARAKHPDDLGPERISGGDAEYAAKRILSSKTP